MKSNNYQVVKELVRQINQDNIQVLSSSQRIKKTNIDLAVNLQTTGNNKITQSFIMKVMDAQFQSAIWRHKELLQQLIDCAMKCQEGVFECVKTDGHLGSCALCELSRKASASCFMLAKNLVESQAVSPQLLLQCVEGCKNFVAGVGKTQIAFSQQCMDECQLCVNACMNLYKKLGLN